MSGQEPTSEELLETIKSLTRQIDKIQGNFDSGKFKGYEAAGNLQKLRRDRQVAINQLNEREDNIFFVLPPKPYRFRRKDK